MRDRAACREHVGGQGDAWDAGALVAEAAGAEEAVAVADGSAGLGRGRSETGTRIGGSRADVPYTAHPPPI